MVSDTCAIFISLESVNCSMYKFQNFVTDNLLARPSQHNRNNIFTSNNKRINSIVIFMNSSSKVLLRSGILETLTCKTTSSDRSYVP